NGGSHRSDSSPVDRGENNPQRHVLPDSPGKTLYTAARSNFALHLDDGAGQRPFCRKIRRWFWLQSAERIAIRIGKFLPTSKLEPEKQARIRAKCRAWSNSALPTRTRRKKRSNTARTTGPEPLYRPYSPSGFTPQRCPQKTARRWELM